MIERRRSRISSRVVWYVSSQDIEITLEKIKELISMQKLNDNNEMDEELIWKLTSFGIKDWAKENKEYLELIELTNLKWMTRTEQIDLIKDYVVPKISLWFRSQWWFNESTGWRCKHYLWLYYNEKVKESDSARN